MRDPARCGPLSAALKRGDESDTTQRGHIVPHHGVKDASLAVVQNHQHRFIVARALVLRIGVRRRQHRHVLSRPAQRAVKLVWESASTPQVIPS